MYEPNGVHVTLYESHSQRSFTISVRNRDMDQIHKGRLQSMCVRVT